MSARLEIVQDPARAAAALMISSVLCGGEIVLVGGSTPRTAYEHFVREVHDIGLNLSATRFWIGDERCVGPDNDLSNFKMIEESLLGPLAGTAAPKVHRMRGELGPSDGADDYERQLRDAGPPEFDLVLLGLGPDGHTASLFPEQSSLSERSRLVVGVPDAGHEPFVPRITMTLPALAAARQVVFVVSGSSKADAVAAAFGPDSQPQPRIPASMVVGEIEPLVVVLDRDAAARVGAGAR
jgi:6-phosphogluconolactonase